MEEIKLILLGAWQLILLGLNLIVILSASDGHDEGFIAGGLVVLVLTVVTTVAVTLQFN